MNQDRLEWSGQAVCYKLQSNIINTVWCSLTKGFFFIFSINILFLTATQSAGGDSPTQVLWKIPFFERMMSRKGISYPSYYKCNSHHLLFPFLCDAICNGSFSHQLPSVLGREEKQKKPQKFLPAAGRKFSSFPSQKYYVFDLRDREPYLPLMLIPLACTYPPTIHKLQLE